MTHVPATLKLQVEERAAGRCEYLRKGAKTHAEDPITGALARLFHPRQDEWSQHFRWQDCVLHGLTPSGRATIEALSLNRPLIIEIRKEEEWRGRHPP
jgi:hypothetical protein